MMILEERLSSVSIVVLTHSPDLFTKGHLCNSEKFVVPWASIWAGYNAPFTSVPVLDERLIAEPLVGSTHSPDVVRRAPCHAKKSIINRAWTWAGDDAPLCAIPVLNEGVETVVRLVQPYGPDIVC